MNIFKVHGSRYLNPFGNKLHSGDLCLSLRRVPRLMVGRHRLCEMPPPTVCIGFLRHVKHLTVRHAYGSQCCLGGSRTGTWALPGSQPLGLTWNHLWGTVRADACLARALIRAPFSQMDSEPFLASALLGAAFQPAKEKSQARLGFPVDFTESVSYGLFKK